MKFTLVVEDHPDDCSIKAEFDPPLNLEQQPKTTARVVAVTVLAAIAELKCEKELVSLEGKDTAGKTITKRKPPKK